MPSLYSLVRSAAGQWALCLLPLLLVALAPLHLSFGLIHPKLAKHGLMDLYWIVAGIGGTVFLCLNRLLMSPPDTEAGRTRVLLMVGILASIILRISLLDVETADYLGALSHWYVSIQTHGGFAALRRGDYSDYNALYLYIMAFLTYLPLSKLYAIKAASILFDYIGAWAAWKIVRLRHPEGLRPALAALAVLFAPTCFFNSALWAQCDMMYTAFLLWALYAMLRMQQQEHSGKPEVWQPYWVVAWWAVALMFKLQAVFFCLPLGWLYVRRSLVWWKAVGVTALVWGLTLLPAWLLGRPLYDLLLIYARQVVNYPMLSLNAPTVYHLLPEAPFEVFNRAGVVLTGSVVVVLVLLLWHRRWAFTSERIVALSLLSVTLVPYLLPRMHERYFFAADMLAVVYAFYFPRRWYVPVVMGFVSLMSYMPFLFDSQPFSFQVLSLILGGLIALQTYWLAREAATGA